MDIRQQMLARRRAFFGSEKVKADKAIHKTLLATQEFYNSSIVCIYRSLLEEVDTSEVLTQKKSFVVLEQRPSQKFPDISHVDLFIVPGVAFDRQGGRLGRGRGYYDRLLAGLTATKIGLAYSFQIVPRLSHKKYDIPMDIVITENETITS